MKFSLYHYLMISSLSLLIGCISSEVEDTQSQIKKTETATSVPVRKAHIDPNTGKLTSTPPASATAQRSTSTADSAPVILDTVVNADGVKLLVPRNPIRHELKANIDCNGDMQVGHEILEQPKNCQTDLLKEDK